MANYFYLGAQWGSVSLLLVITSREHSPIEMCICIPEHVTKVTRQSSGKLGSSDSIRVKGVQMGRERGGRGGRECQEDKETSGKAEFSFTALPAAGSASAGVSLGHAGSRCISSDLLLLHFSATCSHHDSPLTRKSLGLCLVQTYITITHPSSRAPTLVCKLLEGRAMPICNSFCHPHTA